MAIARSPFSPSVLRTPFGLFEYFRLEKLHATAGTPPLDRLPFSIRILLEALMRNVDGFAIRTEDVTHLAAWNASKPSEKELPFKPARVILQDFTGVPLLVDIAAMRAAVQRLGKNPKIINPSVRVDLVVDHSVQVDAYGTPDALVRNAALEFSRNQERYAFLKWGQQSVQNFRVVPPATGIVHQVNLEHLAQGVLLSTDLGGKKSESPLVYPDSLVGTDSHTTMINGLGVLGWGVGGLEAEAVMLDQPLFMLPPRVVGFRLAGTLQEGVTATDLTLTITQMLRKKGVVDQFVEFFGAGLSHLSVEDRATIANMAPEYGATVGFFPVDDLTLAYLRRTGRDPDRVALCERYYKEQGLFRTDATPDPIFSDTLELDLSTVEPSLAGPKRPQDRIAVKRAQAAFQTALTAPIQDNGFALQENTLQATSPAEIDGKTVSLTHGSVVIAAITSCTNTSNPSVMLAAGLLARKAVQAGLRVPSYVKTSLAPGSRVVTRYLDEAGLTPFLQQLGFYTVGYGCTTCIGNSGPLPEAVEHAITQGNLVVASVLSGNRNFEGRIHPAVRANYLASPPLVVAYAIAGTMNIDLMQQPLGVGSKNQPVYLKDIWPSSEEIQQALGHSIKPEMFSSTYAHVFEGDAAWNNIESAPSELYPFQAKSTYIQEPPFFQGFSMEATPRQDIHQARVLCMLGDSITTDHISPAGSFSVKSPAGAYLVEQGVQKSEFNSYGARRGNDRVMVRGTFANVRLKNQLVPGVEGGVTLHFPSGQQMSIFDAAQRYKQEHTPLIILAGKEYGTGSSRDWAAKGTSLLGVRAVLAESFERIHRSNLVGMGILPLVFLPGQRAETLGLTGRELFDIALPTAWVPQQQLTIQVTRENKSTFSFSVLSRLDTPIDVHYYQQGGILQAVLRDRLAGPSGKSS